MALIKEIRKEVLVNQTLSQLGGDATSLASPYYAYILTLTDGTALLVMNSYLVNLSNYTPYDSKGMYTVDSSTKTYEETIKSLENSDLLNLNWSLFTANGKDLLCEFLKHESGRGDAFYTSWIESDEVNLKYPPVIMNSKGGSCIKLSKTFLAKYRSFCYAEFDSIEELESALIIQEPVDDSKPPTIGSGGVIGAAPPPEGSRPTSWGDLLGDGGSTPEPPTGPNTVEVKKKSTNTLALVGLAALGLVFFTKKK